MPSQRLSLWICRKSCTLERDVQFLLYIKYDHLHLFMYLLVYVITYIQQIISNNYMLELHVEILDRNKQYISTEAFQNFS